MSPGNHPLVITVGAVNTLGNSFNRDDRAATYSSKGPTPIDQIVKPDLVALGNRINALQASNSTRVNTYPLTGRWFPATGPGRQAPRRRPTASH